MTIKELQDKFPDAPKENKKIGISDVSKNNNPTDFDLSQWQVNGNGVFRPATQTIPKLHSGVYKIGKDDRGLYILFQPVISDDIIELPETINIPVLEDMKKFWASRNVYDKFGLIYKRGILLYGPPGSGKTCTLQLLMKELISLDGVVFLCSHPDIMVTILSRFRIIEPDRSLIVIMEDIDEMIEQYGEHQILTMLDGENQVNNCVYVATTNYPDKLNARIANRPSRFDERIFVGMPSAVARRAYFKNISSSESDRFTEEMLEKWVIDTDGMSIAHLRELFVACFCLDKNYEDVLERLRLMSKRPKVGGDGFSNRGKTAGFLNE